MTGDESFCGWNDCPASFKGELPPGWLRIEIIDDGSPFPSDPEQRAIMMSWVYAPERLLCPRHARRFLRLAHDAERGELH
jgi:hypothetical protein